MIMARGQANRGGSFVRGSAGEYKALAASATTTLGAGTKIGDYIEGLIIVVNTAATATVSIKDGADAAIPIFPASPGGGVGTYNVAVGARSRTGGWSVIVGAGCTVIAVGNFT